MTALKVLQQALADGLSLAPAEDGTLAVRGPAEARARHLPAIRQAKDALLAMLREPRREWLVADPDGRVCRHCFAPPQTLAQVLLAYPGTVAVPAELGGDPLPEDMVEAVNAYLDRIGEDCATTRREVLERARDNPEALRYFQAMARRPGAAHEAPGTTATDPTEPPT
jgi:hypothetical protein